MPSARESAEANKSNNHRYAKQHDDPTRTKYVVVVLYKKKKESGGFGRLTSVQVHPSSGKSAGWNTAMVCVVVKKNNKTNKSIEWEANSEIMLLVIGFGLNC